MQETSNSVPSEGLLDETLRLQSHGWFGLASEWPPPALERLIQMATAIWQP